MKRLLRGELLGLVMVFEKTIEGELLDLVFVFEKKIERGTAWFSFGILKRLLRARPKY